MKLYLCIHLVLSLVARVRMYLVAAIRLVVHSLAFERIGVALFVESGRFLLLCVSTCVFK